MDSNGYKENIKGAIIMTLEIQGHIEIRNNLDHNIEARIFYSETTKNLYIDILPVGESPYLVKTHDYNADIPIKRGEIV